MLVTTIICMLILLVFSYKLTAAIKAPLEIMLHVCDKLSKGNFSVNTPPSTRGDEFGDVQRGLYDMTMEVSKLLKSFSRATEQQSASAQEIAAASDALAKQAQEVQENLQRFRF